MTEPNDTSPEARAEAEIILAMAKAHDREESAQKGEPSPWREDFERDPDWEQERFLAMREAYDVANEHLSRRDILKGEEPALAIFVLEKFAEGTGPLTPADARRIATMLRRRRLPPLLPLDEVLEACRVHPKGAPDFESVGEPGDEWSILPMMRSYDMDDGAIIVRPSGLAMMLTRGKLALPMEVGALALAEIARGEWHELLRQGRYMLELFERNDDPMDGDDD